MIACTECDMPCAPGEFHPFAACLMFKGCHNSATVRANLAPFATLAAAFQAEVDARRDKTEAVLAERLAFKRPAPGWPVADAAAEGRS